jgi:ring-1,2-phenylacetyl-CoA epoxidase subunit PaaE
MSTAFYTLTIDKINKETNDCVSISFAVDSHLQEIFRFTQGQYITLKTIIDGIDIRRSYSICSSVASNQLTVAIKKVEGGVFSTWANTFLQVGNTIDVMPPMGKFFTTLDIKNSNKYVAIAVGSGITPILSIIKTTLETEPLSSVVLIYGNKNSSNVIFKEEIETLKNKYFSRIQLVYILSREKTDAPINYGRIDANKMQQLSKIVNWQQVDAYFLCGPEEMIFTAKDFLEHANVDAKKINFELFTSSQPKKKREVIVASDSLAKSQITIKNGGRYFDVAIGFNDDISILDAAIQNGADLPFACKGGVCCTCKAKLIEGKVEMDVSWGLEHEEIEQGFVLTCQSHPITDVVVLDFDV